LIDIAVHSASGKKSVACIFLARYSDDAMSREQIRARIQEIGIIPAIRVASPEDALFAAGTVCKHGIPIVEVTMTVPGALGVISELARGNPLIIVGAGSIADAETAARCVDAGAQFLTSTGLDLDVVHFAVQHDIVIIPGVLTPTEVLAASKARPDYIKLFPCAPVGGPAYVRAMRAPFPQVSFIASGGVNQQTALDFLLAGAVALGIGGELIPHEAIERRQEHRIGELARRFLDKVKEARSLMQSNVSAHH
jgi:2-dehydro-3-deoxyphosphogluconate aldolase/(4S)-4-hydroxy-2-oxoglutarate aldolase